MCFPLVGPSKATALYLYNNDHKLSFSRGAFIFFRKKQKSSLALLASSHSTIEISFFRALSSKSHNTSKENALNS